MICVIAQSFAFIYSRNQPNLGLLGITIPDPGFHARCADGAAIAIDLDAQHVELDGTRYPFRLSAMERQLIASGGITAAYQKFGRKLFEVMCAAKPVGGAVRAVALGEDEGGNGAAAAKLQW